MSIVRSTARRIAELEALAKQNVTQSEEIEAKAYYVAMMADVDLSAIEDEEGETMIDGTQQDV